MTDQPRMYVYTENKDVQDLSTGVTNAVRDAEFSSMEIFGGDSIKEYSRIEFEDEEFRLNLYYPNQSEDGRYQVALFSIEPSSAVRNETVQDKLISVIRKIASEVDPKMVYIGDAMIVIDPEQIQDKPDLGYATFFNSSISKRFDGDISRTPECATEQLNNGFLIYPPEDIMDARSTLDAAASHLGTNVFEERL